MPDKNYVILVDRSIISLDGEDARTFLQGLTSNDVEKVDGGRVLHSALLTPQGKYLHDFFIIEHEGGLLLDCEAARLADLKKRLTMYKLRSKVELKDRTEDFLVVAMGEGGALPEGVVYEDPRLPALGVRAVLPRVGGVRILEDAGLTAASFEDYDRRRIRLGVPDGSRDMVIDKAILLENGFNEMGSVDWDKGCYLGQELTARTKYRGLIKKRLLPVDIDGPAPEAGAPITLDGEDAGEMRSSCGNIGLALLRIEQFEKAAESDTLFDSSEAKLSAGKPDWMEF